MIGCILCLLLAGVKTSAGELAKSYGSLTATDKALVGVL